MKDANRKTERSVIPSQVVDVIMNHRKQQQQQQQQQQQ
jgi:hypothetical protein